MYLFAQLIIFFNRDTTNYVVAKQGKIVETFSTQGVIIRDEQLVKSTSSGIVQYYIDGYETVTPETITPEMFDESTYQSTKLRSVDLISAGDPVYKLVTDENWSMIIPMTTERCFFVTSPFSSNFFS